MDVFIGVKVEEGRETGDVKHLALRTADIDREAETVEAFGESAGIYEVKVSGESYSREEFFGKIWRYDIYLEVGESCL